MGALEQNLVEKSYAGFVTGHNESLGSYFSTVRQNNESNEEEIKLETLGSKEYVDCLIKSQEETYNKKYAFERSKFTQCIPNPDPEKKGEMITVQLVRKNLHRREKYKASATK